MGSTQAKQDAVEAKQEAVQRFGQARQAVDKWLTGVGDVLAYFPGTDKARQRLLEQAAEDYEQFARRHSNDLDLEIERGRTYLRLGHLRLRLRDAGGAAGSVWGGGGPVPESEIRGHPDHVDLAVGNWRIAGQTEPWC